MPPSLVLVSCFVCLTPLGLYLLYAASLNSRSRPTLVAGPWDALALVAGLAGCLVFAGPAVVWSAQEAWRGGWQFGDARRVREAVVGGTTAGRVLLVVYAAGVLAGAAWLVRRRRGLTAVYNVPPADFEDIFLRVTGEMGMGWTRWGGRFVLTADVGGPPQKAVVELDEFTAAAHVTLRWLSDETGVRPELERRLARALAGYESPVNPAAAWLMSTAAGLLLVVFLSVAVPALLLVTTRLR